MPSIKPNILEYESEEPYFISYKSNTRYVSSLRLHAHNSYEIYYLFSGHRGLRIGEATYNMDAGDVALIPAGAPHATLDLAGSQHKRVILHFDHDFISGLMQSLDGLEILVKLFSSEGRVLRIPEKILFQLESAFNDIQQEYVHRSPAGGFTIKITIMQVLLFLYKNLQYEVMPSSQGLTRKRSDIVSIAKFIETNYADPLTLSSVASMFYINCCALSRVFKKHMGVTLNSYINQVRISAAKELLENTTMNLTAIATKVGYESLTYFGRVFRQHTGLSPKEYRKKLA